MSSHIDPTINQRLEHLLEGLFGWERNKNRETVLILAPYSGDESIVLTVNGRPLISMNPMDIASELAAAFTARGDSRAAEVFRDAAGILAITAM